MSRRETPSGWGGWGAQHRPPAFISAPVTARGHLNALVIGGDPEWRIAAARELHRAGPAARLDFLAFDPRQQLEALTLTVAGWLRDPVGGGPDRLLEVGTLFVDDITALAPGPQGALLSLCQRIADRRLPHGAPTRLIAGCAEDPAAAVEAGRLPVALYDCLDKLRVEAPQRPNRSVA